MSNTSRTTGFIYVATTNDPELSGCVKIGYSESLNVRISSIRNIEKYDYMVHYCLEVPKKMAKSQCPDKYVHKIIDILAPDLKSPKNEYYYMDLATAAQLLECIGKIIHSKLIYPMIYINRHNTISFEIDENRIKEMISSNKQASRPSALINYLKSQFGPDIAKAWLNNAVSSYGISCNYGDIYADNNLIAISNFPHSPEYIKLIEEKTPNFWITTKNLDVVLPYDNIRIQNSNIQ